MSNTVINDEKLINTIDLTNINDIFQGHSLKEYILNLNQINLFIGPNNSGKSRFLRALFEDKGTFRFLSNDNKANIKNSLFDPFLIILKEAESQYQIQVNFHKKQVLQSLIDDYYSNQNKLYEFLNIISLLKESDFSNLFGDFDEDSIEIKTIIQQIRKLLDEYRKKRINNIRVNHRLYIPILRGLRPIQINEEGKFINTNAYLRRTVKDYFEDDEEFDPKIKADPKVRVINSAKLSIYTGLSIYDDVMELLLGTEEQRNEIRAFENFLSEKIFFEKITLIPKYKEDVLHIKIGNNPQFEIYNLGDGFQTMITILFPIFRDRDKEMLVFIEEPEIHLHPSWQIQLIKALKQFNNHQFFISTHSSTFINETDTSIYYVNKKEDKTIISYCNSDGEKFSILKDLGYKPSDLYLTNFILWVEGPSDKIYFKYWLNKMAPELKEDKHFSIMSLGGENYKHVIIDENGPGVKFLQKLNPNIGIVLDSDRKNETDDLLQEKQEIMDFFMANNLYCWITKSKEVENYLPLDGFKQGVANYHQKEVQDIEIESGDYLNRNIVTDLRAQKEFKSRIKLPQSIFQQIQINGDGTTKNINDIDLRNAIEEAIQATGKQQFKVKKVPVAREVIKLNPNIENTELQEKLQELIIKIKEANNLE